MTLYSTMCLQIFRNS